MKNIPLWVRMILLIPCVGLIGYAAYGLFLRASGSASGAAIVGLLLVAWVAAYLIWGRKIAARFRK